MELTSERNGRVKVGLDDSCPCGSGKKYQKCHGLGRTPTSLKANPRKPDLLDRLTEEFPTTYVFVFGELPTGTRDLFVTDEPDIELQRAIAWFESQRKITYGVVKAKYDLLTHRVLDVEKLVGKRFEGLGPQRSAGIKDIQDGFDQEDVHGILAKTISQKRAQQFLQRCCGVTLHSPGQELPFNKKKGTEKKAYRPSKKLTNKFTGLKETNLDFAELKETDTENIVFYPKPGGVVAVAGYMVINKTSRENFTIPSVRIHLQDWTDRLHANGHLRQCDVIETISFVYDITNLRVELYRTLDRELGWIQPPQDPEFIKGLEEFLAPFGECWRALHESARKAA